MKTQDQTNPSFVILLSLSIVLCVGSGCSTTETRKVNVKPYATGAARLENRFHLAAALVMDKEFKNYHSRNSFYSVGTMTFIYPFGEVLSQYAKNVSEGMFNQVAMCDSLEGAVNRADVILIPKVVRSNVAIADDYRTQIEVEWLVKDRAGRNSLWLTTIEAKAAASGFNGYAREKASLQGAFDELSVKTLKAFQESPELKRIQPLPQ